MGVSTQGRIKGYVSHDEILNFIRQKYDINAYSTVKKEIINDIKQITWKHSINEHSEDNDHWYDYSGYICFKDGEETRRLFYFYTNVNGFDNLEYYKDYGLEDMVRSEYVSISLHMHGNSIDIIKNIVAHFGGGWLDENDCDDKEYYPIDIDKDGTIKPVIYVTMSDIYEKFGGVVIITDNK